MTRSHLVLAGLLLAVSVVSASAAAAPNSDTTKKSEATTPLFMPTASRSSSSVTVNGRTIDYTAIAGTLVVHAKGWSDAPQTNAEKKAGKNPNAEASMFFVAYFKKGAKPQDRPITFLYNGGPGSSTMWLHMGAFGPRRVVTDGHVQTPPAPYKLVNNGDSLLDASDLVFIDAPGTGFSRIVGKNKDKAFYGVDQDAHAFAEFIRQFLSKYDRWNSPKYLFGESYGTPRSAVLSNMLQEDDDIDLNGVVMLSQILNFALSPDGADLNPGIDLPYEIALPSYAATAWYHHKLPGNPKDLQALIKNVEQFAMGPYAEALAQGSELSQSARNDIAQKLHDYTGLPVAYLLKANLRVTGGEFEKTLLAGTDSTTGRLDTRFAGPTMDPLSKEAEYDPQSAAISSAYVAAFNSYVRQVLHYGKDKTYKPEIDVPDWDYKHQPPGAGEALPGLTNVMPDLAAAMKYNPDLKVFLAGGYFDLATPFYEGWYEMHHLQMPERLQKNIQYHYYQSGHMVYVNTAALKKLHDDVAAFIRATDNLKGQ